MGGARYPKWATDGIRRAEAEGQRWRPCRYCATTIILSCVPLKGGGWSKPKFPLEADGSAHDDNCTRKSVADGYVPAVSHRITKGPTVPPPGPTRQRKLTLEYWDLV